MAKVPSADEVVAKLDEIKAAMTELFPRNAARLHQLDHHLSTAAMAVEHLFDEQVRADFARAERIRKAENEE
jgi:hypothetical protein